MQTDKELIPWKDRNRIFPKKYEARFLINSIACPQCGKGMYDDSRSLEEWVGKIRISVHCLSSVCRFKGYRFKEME